MGTYNASKAAANALTETLRLELAPFGIKVVALLTGSVRSKFFDNQVDATGGRPLPEDSIYRVVPGGIKMMQNPRDLISKVAMNADLWAGQVVKDLSRASPPHQIWRGQDASLIRLALHLPIGLADSSLSSLTKLDEVYAALKQT